LSLVRGCPQALSNHGKCRLNDKMPAFGWCGERYYTNFCSKANVTPMEASHQPGSSGTGICRPFFGQGLPRLRSVSLGRCRLAAVAVRPVDSLGAGFFVPEDPRGSTTVRPRHINRDESAAGTIGLMTLAVKSTGERSAGNPQALGRGGNWKRGTGDCCDTGIGSGHDRS